MADVIGAAAESGAIDASSSPNAHPHPHPNPNPNPKPNPNQEGLNRRHSQRLASHGVETSPGKSGGTPQSTRADLSRRFGGFDVAPGGAPLEAESDLLRLRTALEPVLAAPGAHAPSLASR